MLTRRKFYKIVSENYQEYIQKNYRILLKENSSFDEGDMEYFLAMIVYQIKEDVKTWNLNYLCGWGKGLFSNTKYLKQCIFKLQNNQFV